MKIEIIIPELNKKKFALQLDLETMEIVWRDEIISPFKDDFSANLRLRNNKSEYEHKILKNVK